MNRFLLVAASLAVAVACTLSVPAAPSRAVAALKRPAPASHQKKPATSRPAATKRPAAKKTVTAPTLAWPVAGRRIVEPYGERVNPTTKTVTLNPGIGIAAKKGAEVRAAAAGKVSLVSWLPGFGSFVIVEHSDGYRTVYARLGSIGVKRGQSVRLGGRIGTVAGATLHFEVWRGQTRLDPTTLLRK